MKDEFERGRGRVLPAAAPREARRGIVAVGDVDGWGPASDRPAREKGVVFAGFSDITGSLMNMLDPKLILSPLVATEFDCTDLALKLDSMGFSGSYIAVADLPRPDMVEQEIRSLCSRLEFGIVAPADLGLTL